jgi:hypothetical protein
MISDVLKLHGIQSKAGFVEYGYAQVEPNHLSAQRTGQIYAQLPAAADIDVLENGQFAVYDYGYNEDGAGIGRVRLPGDNTDLEPMLVYNEIKLYREHQLDCEFAMVRDNYRARIYSPLDPDTLNWTRQSRFYNGEMFDNDGNSLGTEIPTVGENQFDDHRTYPVEDVTAPTDMYELHYNEEPWHIEGRTKGKKMPADTTMVPRLFKTNIGDHFTTNAIKESTVELGAKLNVGALVGATAYTSVLPPAKSIPL